MEDLYQEQTEETNRELEYEYLNRSDIDKILGEREGQHGDFTFGAITAQGLKTIIRHNPEWTHMRSTHQEAVDNILQKISRLVNGDSNHIDSWDDIIGYATLAKRATGGLDANIG